MGDEEGQCVQGALERMPSLVCVSCGEEKDARVRRQKGDERVPFLYGWMDACLEVLVLITTTRQRVGEDTTARSNARRELEAVDRLTCRTKESLSADE
jgi:hypothetical protein